MSKPRFKTAISGSFKFKPEIDAMHEEFRDFGVTVLEPSLGWQQLPTTQLTSTSFRPLPAELGLTIREIEDRFLRAIDEADFLYVLCAEGYIGPSTALEIGYAFGGDTPVYASQPPDFMELAGYDIERKIFLESSIVIAGVAEVIRIEQARACY